MTSLPESVGVTRVVEDLLDHRSNVVVEESVSHVPALAGPDCKVQMTEDSQVVRDRRLADGEVINQLGHGRRAVEQSRRDTHTRGSGERTHHFSNPLSLVLFEHQDPLLENENRSMDPSIDTFTHRDMFQS